MNLININDGIINSNPRANVTAVVSNWLYIYSNLNTFFFVIHRFKFRKLWTSNLHTFQIYETVNHRLRTDIDLRLPWWRSTQKKSSERIIKCHNENRFVHIHILLRNLCQLSFFRNFRLFCNTNNKNAFISGIKRSWY